MAALEAIYGDDLELYEGSADAAQLAEAASGGDVGARLDSGFGILLDGGACVRAPCACVHRVRVRARAPCAQVRACACLPACLGVHACASVCPSIVCAHARAPAGGADESTLPPGAVRLGCRLVSGYPQNGVPPAFELHHSMLSHILPADGAAAVAAAAVAASVALLAGGETSTIYPAVAAANEALADG
eukprot:2281483-Prymnesium_polylepis.1